MPIDAMEFLKNKGMKLDPNVGLMTKEVSPKWAKLKPATKEMFTKNRNKNGGAPIIKTDKKRASYNLDLLEAILGVKSQTISNMLNKNNISASDNYGIAKLIKKVV